MDGDRVTGVLITTIVFVDWYNRGLQKEELRYEIIGTTWLLVLRV